jgi:hypothetical protein
MPLPVRIIDRIGRSQRQDHRHQDDRHRPGREAVVVVHEPAGRTAAADFPRAQFVR